MNNGLGRFFSLFITKKNRGEIRGDNKTYTRFLIASQDRSGTNMLSSALSQNKSISMGPEIFANKTSEHTKGKNLLINYDPCRFLNGFYYSGYPKETKAVGFKLFPVHLTNPRLLKVWSWFNRHNDHIKVILLVRKNMLASYVSREIAIATGTWNISKTEDRAQITLNIDVEHLEEYFVNREREVELLKMNFSTNESKTLFYEEITNDLEKTFFELQDFLEVRPQEIKPSIIKKESRKMNEIIENYDEVLAYLNNSKWPFLINLNK